MNTPVNFARTLCEERNQNGNKQWETCTTKILTFWFQLVNHSAHKSFYVNKQILVHIRLLYLLPLYFSDGSKRKLYKNKKGWKRDKSLATEHVQTDGEEVMGEEPKTMASLSSQYEKADTCGLDFIFICLKTDFF